MNRTAAGRVVCVATCLLASLLVAQVPNENKANQIVDARRKNADLMRQYSWNCRTELVRDGKVQDVRIDAITYGQDGNLQRTVINDEASGRVPHRFIRHAIAEEKKKEQEKYLVGLHGLLDQYTLPTAGKVIDFLSHAQVTSQAGPDGKGVLQVTGTGVVVPGDTLTLTLDAATLQTRRAEVSTTYDGNHATATVTFNALKSGLNYPQFADVTVPDKDITLQVHNFDYVRNE